MLNRNRVGMKMHSHTLLSLKQGMLEHISLKNLI